MAWKCSPKQGVYISYNKDEASENNVYDSGNKMYNI